MSYRNIICIRCNQPGLREVHGKYCLPCCAQVFKIQSEVYREVKKAIRSGSLPPIETQYCVDCGAFAEHYDHRDYSAPLDVAPVCRACNIRRGPVQWSRAA